MIENAKTMTKNGKRLLTLVIETSGAHKREIVCRIEWPEPLEGNYFEVAPHTSLTHKKIKSVRHSPSNMVIEVRFEPVDEEELEAFLSRPVWKERHR